MTSTSTPENELPVIVRSCDKECLEPTEGTVTGSVPDWLEGCLIRNGPGLFEVGPDKYRHWFDGLALLHRFDIRRGGKVTYQNRFLNSVTYQRNTRARRIVVPEFGTASHPDPCMTIFQRFKSFFTLGPMTDNDCVNVMKIGDGIYAATETSLINRIDPKTLETLEQVDLSTLLPVNTSTAHPHYESDGTLFNMGSFYAGKPAYCIVRFPSSGEDSLKQGSVLCRIPVSRPTSPSYYHSFGLTENYIIFVEQSLTINTMGFLWRQLWGSSYADSLQWNPKQLVQFHVVRRSTGEVVKSKLVAEPFLVFHHANAYESDDGQEVVVDLCAYKDDSVVRNLYLKELMREQEAASTSKPERYVVEDLEDKLLRFVLPLKEFSPAQVESGANLVTLPGSKATATLQKDGSILCKPENLTEGLKAFEMPQINYHGFNGKKYKYVYGVGREKNSRRTGLVKVDTERGTHVFWSSPGVNSSEPIFVPKPSATEEDDGVLLSSLLTTADPKSVSLLVLDAKTMTELAKADFKCPGVVPSELHGMFLKC